LTGRFLAAYHVGVVSDALGAGAAILLVVSWSPAVDWHPASRLRPLQVMLLSGVGLSQIAVLIFAVTQREFVAQALAELVIGLAVTWYAVNLRASALGGALVLGWSTVVVLGFISAMSPWTAIGVLGCVLMATVVILAFIYLRGPAHPGPEFGADTADPAQPGAGDEVPVSAPSTADPAPGQRAELGNSPRYALRNDLRAVDAPGTTYAFCFHRGRHLIFGILAVALGAACLALLVGTLATAPSQLSMWDQFLFAGGGLALIWLGARQFRVGIQISGDKLIIRNEWRSHTVNVSEVRAITLQPKSMGQGPDHWMPRVDLTGGKSVWITNFDSGQSDRQPKAEQTAALNEVRALLRVGGDNDFAEPETR
jgi:hypothetical protein